MSEYTKVILEDPITLEEIYNFFKAKIDPMSKLRIEDPVKFPVDDPSSTKNMYLSGYIYYESTSVYLGTAIHSDFPDLKLSTDSIEMLFDCTERSVNIAKLIANQFGGYVKENEDEDTKFYHMPKNPDKDIPKIFKLTYDELCEKLGGIVIITDRN
jgi:hypothetical protein